MFSSERETTMVNFCAVVGCTNRSNRDYRCVYTGTVKGAYKRV